MSQKILLDKINIPGIKTYEVYRANGGYASVEKALKTLTPDEVVEEVKEVPSLSAAPGIAPPRKRRRQGQVRMTKITVTERL